MQRVVRFFIFIIFLCIISGVFTQQVYAAKTCSPDREIEQWSCVKGTSTCPPGSSWQTGGCAACSAWSCVLSSNHSLDCPGIYGSGTVSCPGNCYKLCDSWETVPDPDEDPPQMNCTRTDGSVSCSSAADGCKATNAPQQCSSQSKDGSCDVKTLPKLTFLCWIGSDDPATVTPGGHTPTRSPTPPVCTIDGGCGIGETCANCPADCCINSTTSITVSVVKTDSVSCADIKASTDYVTPTDVTLTSGAWSDSKTITGSSVIFSGLEVDKAYAIGIVPPENLVSKQTCLFETGSGDLIGTGLRSVNLSSLYVDGENYIFITSLTSAGTWSQTGGGNVHANQQVTSLVPVTVPQSYLSELGTGGYPGLVSYGTSLDASLAETNGTEDGGNLSPTRWNVNQTYQSQPLYEHFALLLGGMTGTGNPLIAPGELSHADLSCGNSHCYFIGDVTINSPITIGANEKRIVVINGALTINNTITVTPGGFLAFIVKDSITVNPSVGAAPVRYSAAAPHIQGMYITDGTFSIPASATPPDTQLVLKGSFIANDFSITRVLTDIQNPLYPATVFMHDPSLLFSMPLILQEVPFRWQEVAP